MSLEKSENRDTSGSGKKDSGQPAKNKNPEPPKWHHPSSKIEASALKAMLEKQAKKNKPRKQNPDMGEDDD